jgi:prophage antirepressor-like protein
MAIAYKTVEFRFGVLFRRPIANFDELTKYALVRSKRYKGEEWYAAQDICDLLELSKYRTVVRRVSGEYKRLLQIRTRGGGQKMTCVNIDGIREIVKNGRKSTLWGMYKYLELD